MSSFLLIRSTSNKCIGNQVLGRYDRLIDVLLQIAEDTSLCCSIEEDQILHDINTYYTSCDSRDEWIYPRCNANDRYIVKRIY